MNYTIDELAEFVSGKIKGTAQKEITGIAGIDQANASEISFIEKEYRETKAACVIVPETFLGKYKCPTIVVKNPKLAFAKIAQKLHPAIRRNQWHQPLSIAETATVEADYIGPFVSIGNNSTIAKGVQIHAGVQIGDNVSIGENSIIHSNCVIYDNSEIGDNVILHGGTIIGADGFGYIRDEAGEHIKFPQIGRIVIEDNVEIGANSCLDRGALGETRIGAGTKIDNLVQVGHNVKIGKRVVIAAEVGISGSVVIEDDCMIGGQTGIGEHAHLYAGAIIGGGAAILPRKVVRAGVWWGFPVQPIDDFKRQVAHIKGLGRLKDDVKELKKLIKKV